MVSGFTIKDGRASEGGAIYCKDSSPTIENSVITNNSARGGKSKPYAISESTQVWWDPISRPGESRFNQYDDWPAWPEKYRGKDWKEDPETGYNLYSEILPSHSSLMHLNWDNYESDYSGPFVHLSRVLLNGMTQADNVISLVPLARYWENPPLVKVTGYGYSEASFDKAQKAYIIDRRGSWVDSLINRDDDKLPNKKPDEVNLTVLASEQSPVINPCFIIRNWPEDTRARLYIDGRKISPGKNFRQGVERSWNKWGWESSLAVWVRHKSKKPVDITIEMVK